MDSQPLVINLLFMTRAPREADTRPLGSPPRDASGPGGGVPRRAQEGLPHQPEVLRSCWGGSGEPSAPAIREIEEAPSRAAAPDVASRRRWPLRIRIRRDLRRPSRARLSP